MKFATVIPLLGLVLAPAAFGQVDPESIGTAPALSKGVVVEAITKGTQADKRGVLPGDILLDWTRGNFKGEISSPFDLLYIRFEQASRGPVTVGGLRQNKRRTWRLSSDAWGIVSRPNLPGPLLSIYQEGLDLVAAGNPVHAAEHWRNAVPEVNKYEVPWLGPWFPARAGQVLSDAHQSKLSDDAYREAIRQSTAAGVTVRAELLRQWAVYLDNRSELVESEKVYQEHYLEWTKLAPKAMTVANSLLLLGSVSLERDELDRAENHLKRALAIAAPLAPTSFQTASIFEDLGILFEDRSDLGKAEEYYLKALAIEERYFSGSRQLASTLTNIGTLAYQRGDVGRAEAYHRRALPIAEKLANNDYEIADILRNLSQCVLDRGDFQGAEEYQQRALAIEQRIAAGGLLSSYSLASLGTIARLRGDLVKAEEFYRQTLAIAAKVDVPPRDLARLFTGEAAVLRDQGDFPKAQEFYRRALAIIEQVNPGSIDHAEALADLAGTLHREGQLDSAIQLYGQALGALENRALYLGGVDEDRSRYRAWYTQYYQEYMDVLLRQGQREKAFELLEASRARTLFEMLAQAHIDLARGADPSLVERERTLGQMLNAKSEHRIRLGAQNTDRQFAGLDSEIEEILLQYQQVQAQLRASSPDYAALTQPQPLSATEIQKLLDANTLLLEYALGDERSYVWAVTDSSLMAYELPKRSEIEKHARRVFDLLTLRNRVKGSQNGPDSPIFVREYETAAKNLSEMVLGPVAQMLKGKRLLIVSDGALQYVPFSALPTPGHPANALPLVVTHEIVNLPSASILAELRRQQMGRAKPAHVVAVFADPVFDPADDRVQAGGSHLSSPFGAAARRGDLIRSAADLGLTRDGRLNLSRLIYTRNEADAIMAVTPLGRGMAAVDFRANRDMATNGALAKYRIVHFATHGILNNKHPELSGLVLSLVNDKGKSQDGFLKLQDIYNLKLPVDLVVLSGCETGLGQEVHGEGLIGLTRGFMYAGATRVVASLWNVSDMATASLMAEFYRAMEKDGMRPAAALRAAQIKMWNEKQWSSPYYWAAFQIQGEWR